ncbi:2-succinyl-5-enolpyruvyl-6-hydroxy-3-cyclohexene-1-carboxylic-acid synthase [Nocardioides sp. Y6]|uniref:2-succinyl-5-enolpyruvyl-6-hydroxy-3-cyclohexene-1-carboxylate synthase n=1 Tax=Nocardioides malaquae TaxID=2773426 RepID=A0ABR9RVF0_9ACTN|nr:2-succinyl-5-enolpyruvyl-6-hydroxy-3-cyclohexene-1-carboxylic-acid synthase [Nocardioides malaquae]MBE7325558.1 2-succinyl-5-enolpyruvyl-6-hydroxy-3-cyclohexene-1-carboxylic-acid synthase [Nocardioides malaquae]
MSDSTQLARQVVQALLDAGVREAVLAPGSRNAPLSFALLAADRAGALRLHTRIDERSAGFLALGLARTSGRPVAVSCTSGTAVANLAPAALEAHHEHLPWIAVTADRPLRLRGTSANQTTEQVGLLPRAEVLDLAAGDEVDVPVGALLAARGPVHLNVQFDEPLTPVDDWVPRPTTARPPAPASTPEPKVLARGPRTVVVAGDGAGPAARLLAEQAGWPLLAEPSSGARAGSHAVPAYRVLLGTELAAEVERVVVAGHPTLSRPVARLLGREDVEVVDLAPDDRWQPRPFPVVDSAPVWRVGDGAPDLEWLDRWREAGRSLAARVRALLRAEGDVTPHEVAGVVAGAVGARDLLFVGPSNPVRDLDLMMTPPPVDRSARVVANRGLAGIDGVVSSAIGAALAHGAEGRTIALMGDVTFLHDQGGLVLGPHEPRPNLTLVVVNDDGGSIFSLLEQGGADHAHAFERLFGTPHGVDLAALCAATRTPHWRVESVAELEHALSQPAGGIEVVEVRVRRDNRREIDERVRNLRP